MLAGRRELALASLAAGGATILVCAGVALMTAACGVRISAQDFPVLKLSGPEDNARK
ncbi:MAG: hypothetical protein WA863_09385 [Methyloceanibacter sp.]